ncbi:MAG: response regulator [Candidatus Omnitrophica bacterium]|nr:response regulator [Candidatus Omnitrophota bacterium]
MEEKKQIHDEKIKDVKILIGMEDSEQKKEIVDILSETFTVHAVSDSEEAYQEIHKFDPDLVILDYSLSKINPIDLHDGIAFIHSYISMVICATEENLEVARRVWSRRAIDFIIKPFETGSFIQDVNKIMRNLINKREVDALSKQVKQLEEAIKKIRTEMDKKK